MSEANQSPVFARWLALGAAAGAAIALLMDHTGTGSWRLVALVLALLALFGVIVIVVALRKRDVQLNTHVQVLERGRAEVDALQREIERHKELERQLQQAKHTAESAVLAKGEFLATMSHEIRTPLNGVIPMLDLLLSMQLPQEQRDLVRTAYASSQQLLRIVDDILDYSKLEAHRLELENTVFNLRDLLDDVTQWMRQPAAIKGLRLDLVLDPTVRLPVRGDPVRLRQVLSNLIGNAVKFTEQGSVTVSVSRLGETGSQHLLRFEIRDTGMGITDIAREQLFSAFAQGDASTTRLYGGTGLGLAICKRIVDLMGGRIGVDSVAGAGATFHFEIPLTKVQGDLAVRAEDAAGSRLLLLTLDETLRRRLAMVLSNWGLRVTAVGTVHEALVWLRAAVTQGAPWQYSIVLADLNGMRGTAVALQRNLEGQSQYGDVRLICLFGDDAIPEELKIPQVVLVPRQGDEDALRAALVGTSPAASRQLTRVAQGDHRRKSDASVKRLWAGRLLLVEDNPVNLLVAQELLKVLGLGCDTAANGKMALQMMAQSRYDLVLMDCQMPVLDGYTTTRRWRDIEAATNSAHRLPIVAMTANAMAGDRQKCLDAGMDDYLAKPVTRAQMDECLSRWLSERKSGSNPATPVSPAPARAIIPVPEPRVMVNTATLDELEAAVGPGIGRIIATYLENTPRLIAQMKTAAEVPDLSLLRGLAHSLKSSSANLGADALSEAAKRIELEALQQTLERPAAAVAVVVAAFDHVRPILTARMHAAANAHPA